MVQCRGLASVPKTPPCRRPDAAPRRRARCQCSLGATSAAAPTSDHRRIVAERASDGNMNIFMIKRAAALQQVAPRCTPCCRMALRARALPLGIDEWSAKDDYLQAEARCHAFRGSTTRTGLIQEPGLSAAAWCWRPAKSFRVAPRRLGWSQWMYWWDPRACWCVR